MSPRRRALVLALNASIVAATAASIVLRAEAWPICYYPMFASVQGRSAQTSLRLRLVDGRGREIGYPAEEGVLYRELDGYSALVVLRSLGSAEHEARARFLGMLLDDLRRRRGGDDRPRAIRLYRVDTEFRGDALRPVVVRRRLLDEVARP